MNSSDNPIGSVYISHRSIASIASQSALASYGIVGLASKNLASGLSQVLTKDPVLGVDVFFDNTTVSIDLYLIIEYGTRIKSVADNVSEYVKYQIEKTTGLTVKQVNVHVRGLRISNTD